MSTPSLQRLDEAAGLVHAVMPPTPQICWPLLCARAGCEVWVKHENHTPIGSFKVRGGIRYIAALMQSEPGVTGVLAATRGNHGQSVAFAAGRAGLASVVVVPHGNSAEKNAAMRAFGAEIVEHGHDFQAAYEHARGLAAARGLHMLASYHPWLVEGVASYGLELLRAVPGLDAVYVPIGLGSGISATIAARDALGLTTQIIGVVAAAAPAYALSFEARRPVSTETALTMADGVACRIPVEAALETIWRGAERVVSVSEAEIMAAMRHYFTDTHNVAEGAGAAPLAALLQERRAMAGKKLACVLSGGNIDRPLFAQVISEV